MTNIITKPILIPDINMATVNMICMQYDIPYSAVQNRLNYYKEEFAKESIVPKNKSEFESMFPDTTQFVWNKNRDGSVGYMFTNAAYVSIKFGKTKLLSEHAVNRLIDILNTDGRKNNNPNINRANKKKDTTKIVTPKSKIIFDTEEEEVLCLNLAKAYSSGELINVISAAMALDKYRKRVIFELKNKLSEAEQSSLMPWTSRGSAKRLVNRLSEICGERPIRIWESVYYKIIHEYNIPLEGRGKRPLINGLKDEEWHVFYQAFTDICKEKYMDAERIMKVAGIDTSGLAVVTKC